MNIYGRNLPASGVNRGDDEVTPLTHYDVF